MAEADAALFVFDSSDVGSLHAAMQLLQRTAAEAGDALPCVLLAAKDDLGMSPVSHHTVLQPFTPCLSKVLASSDVDTLWETEPGHVSIIWILASFPGCGFPEFFNPSVLPVRLKGSLW